MFSLRQKQEISEHIQRILAETDHPELPEGEISFLIHIEGKEKWSWADIRNNGYFSKCPPSVNPWNERQESLKKI